MKVNNKNWRIIDLINWGDNSFSKYDIHNSKREIEWFLCHVLNCKRIDLYIRFDEVLNEENLATLRKMVKRRIAGEPFQHIIKKASFYGRDYFVSNNVLIPRPETELIIERLKYIGKVQSLLDIGTGSGCLSITISLECLANKIFATDISESAIKIAKKNKKILKAHNIQFSVNNCFDNNFVSKYDVIVSNPPYIPKQILPKLENVVKNYEPNIALTDFDDGLTFYKFFSNNFYNLLNSNGILILEFGGSKQKSNIKDIFDKNNLNTKFFRDLQNEWRVVEVRGE